MIGQTYAKKKAGYKLEEMTIRLTSAEINMLIYHYLQERGLQHSAFVLQREAAIPDTPVPPGKLTEVLYKGLVLQEVEAHASHFAGDGEGPQRCISPFTLLQHECAYASTGESTSKPANGECGRDSFVVAEGHSAAVTLVSFCKDTLLSG